MNDRQPQNSASVAAAPIDCDEEEARLASQSLAAGDPSGWFEALYAAGASGRVTMPFDRAEAHPLLVEWADNRQLAGRGQRAIVVGCGLGADAEYVSSRGFSTTGFDISETAIQVARRRHQATTVDYVVADLLNPPPQWTHGFDLVIEIITVQALPEPPRRQAITNISRLVGPGGTLIVVAAAPGDEYTSSELPPWPLTRDDIETFACDGLTIANIETISLPDSPSSPRWRAELYAAVRRTPATPSSESIVVHRDLHSLTERR
jgi:SAM-dependent methyltransferase